jgi:hypothetical protein
MRIKNWEKHQHFKDRRPPWIKLYKDILEQRDIAMLSDCTFRVLIGIWLLASEDELMEGHLPEIDEIAFRLRIEKPKIIKALNELGAFLIHDDIATISPRYWDDVLETETETETKAEKRQRQTFVDDGFESFWQAYPKKTGKGAARKAWEKARPDIQQVQAALSWQVESEAWTKEHGQFIPNPATYINQERWTDEPPKIAMTKLTKYGQRALAVGEAWLANGESNGQ